MSKNKLEWYGETPNDWFIKKGKYLYKFIQTGKRDSGENNPNGKYPFFTCSKEILNIDKYSFEMEALLVAGNGIVGETKYYNGKFDAYQRVYVISDFTSEIHVPYLKIYMMNNFMIYLTWRMIGSVINFVKLEDIKNFDITFPKIEKQIQITEYLNNKLGKIDMLIENQQQQIEKLKEYKQSLISEVVTKGLDPNAEMKDSGIEWIKRIPTSWIISPLKVIFSLNKGISITKSDLVDEGIPVINYGEIHSKYGFEFNPIENQLKCITYETYENNNVNVRLNKGDFVFCDTSEDLEGSGNFSILNQNNIVVAGYHTIVAKPQIELDSRYFAYLFTSDYWRYQIRSRVYGIKLFSITQTILRNISVILPHIKEQQSISEFLDSKVKKINRIIEIKNEKIDELNEYKKSLIYEYVTGKKEMS